MTRPRLASVVLVLTVTTWAGVAAPAPSIWRRAAAPSTHAAAEMRQRAGDQLDEHVRLGQRAALRSQPQATVAALDGAAQALDGAENHRDPMLRHQMGRVHHYRYQLVSDARELELAIEHFQYVVRHPRTPTTLRASALQTMAVSYARLGRHRDEIEVYDEALTLEPDPDSHAVLLANQAEGLMARGRILQAVRGYRAALRVTSTVLMLESGVTTLWGLAVALDRSGDLEGALASIASARRYDPLDQRLNGPGWFFVPAYDEAYYAALGHWQRARAARDMADRDESYGAAIASWRSFLDRAPRDDPWAPIAQRRLADCQREQRERRAR